MALSRVRAMVDAAFVRTGAATAPWPDPHPAARPPSSEEYSRCLYPGKFRIVGARARAWTQALTELGLAAAEHPDGAATVWRTLQPNLAGGSLIRLQPAHPGAAPLVLRYGALKEGDDDGGVKEIPETVVDVGAGDPAVLLASVPRCGCDACDDGSDPLLEELDEHIQAVITGKLVHVALEHGHILATGNGWSAGGDGRFCIDAHEVEEILRAARAGRCKYPVVHGAPWW